MRLIVVKQHLPGNGEPVGPYELSNGLTEGLLQAVVEKSLAHTHGGAESGHVQVRILVHFAYRLDSLGNELFVPGLGRAGLLLGQYPVPGKFLVLACKYPVLPRQFVSFLLQEFLLLVDLTGALLHGGPEGLTLAHQRFHLPVLPYHYTYEYLQGEEKEENPGMVEMRDHPDRQFTDRLPLPRLVRSLDVQDITPLAHRCVAEIVASGRQGRPAIILTLQVCGIPYGSSRTECQGRELEAYRTVTLMETQRSRRAGQVQTVSHRYSGEMKPRQWSIGSTVAWVDNRKPVDTAEIQQTG